MKLLSQYRIAIHEAGHAAVARHLGFEVRSIQLGKHRLDRPDDPTQGFCEICYDWPYDFRYVVAQFAGLAAEFVDRNLNRRKPSGRIVEQAGATSDFLNARDATAGYCNRPESARAEQQRAWREAVRLADRHIKEIRHLAARVRWEKVVRGLEPSGDDAE